jgi:hypothetical protein
MTREQILPFEGKVITIKFRKNGYPNEATGRLIEINGESMYLRLFGANLRWRIYFEGIEEIKETPRTEKV